MKKNPNHYDCKPSTLKRAAMARRQKELFVHLEFVDAQGPFVLSGCLNRSNFLPGKAVIFMRLLEIQAKHLTSKKILPSVDTPDGWNNKIPLSVVEIPNPTLDAVISLLTKVGEFEVSHEGFTVQKKMPPKDMPKTAVFVVNDVIFHGGKAALVTDATFAENELAVNCTNRCSYFDEPEEPDSAIIERPDWFPSDDFTIPFVPPVRPHELVVEWPDFSTPDLSVEFWRDLPKICKANGIAKVTFFCMGGKGRTGTALCATLIAAKGVGTYDAITFVRDTYHAHAVETKRQLNYLKGIERTLGGPVDNEAALTKMFASVI